MARFRICLVGAGGVAQFRSSSAYAKLTDSVELAAVCDKRLDRAAELAAPYGARIYGDYEEALNDPRIDGVDLCVPHPMHAPLALQALSAGKHVLVEKPIATSVADAEAMVETAERNGLTLVVSENYPYLEPFRTARRMIQDGEIGELVTLRSHRVGYLEGVWLRDGWRQNADLAGGGMLLDQGCHYTNILRMLGGEIDAVCAFSTNVRPDWKGEDTATLILRFASGVIGEALYCWGTKTPDIGHEAYAFGERGSLDLGGAEPVLVLHRPDLPGGKRVIFESMDYYDAFRLIVEDFARSAQGLQHPTMPGREGLADLKVVMAAYRSIASGRVERV